MSNILIIKHGSLGDIAQACGAIQDISVNHKGDEIYLLTTKPYFDLLKKNPHISDVILDKRLSRLNLIYLYSLMKNIKKYNFSKVYDLQNSRCPVPPQARYLHEIETITYYTGTR